MSNPGMIPNTSIWGPNRAAASEPPKDNSTNTNTNTNTNAADNGGIDDKTIDNLWNDIEDDKKKDNGGSDQNNQNNNNNQDTRTPDEQLAAYLKSVNLEPVTLSEQDKEAVKNGDFEGVLDRLNANIRNAHVQALRGTQTMIQNAVETAVAKATQNSTSYYEGKEARNFLHSELPYTADPAISPVAITVMQRLMDRGMKREDAVKGVDKFFNKVSTSVNPDYVPPNPNLSSNYGGRKNNKSGNQTVDFLDILNPK